MAERIHIDHGSFEAGKRKIEQWKVPESVKKELLRFLDDLSLGKVNRGKRISPQRQLKYIYALRAPLEFFDRPTVKLTVRDIERFERALAAGQLANHFTRKPFAHSTQVDMRLLLRVFLRWRLGKSKADTLAGWLDTRSRPKTPDFLKETEVLKLYRHCRTAEQRFLIAILFDCGCRAEEFHNIRYEDVYMPEGKRSFVQIVLKQEYSKTLGRTVTLLWRHSLEAVQEYLAERIAEGIKPTDPVFKGRYAATRKFLQRFGKQVLQRPVHYHLFRHSSATFYASQMNRQQLCNRFGWRYASGMVDIYISRSGMETKDLDEKFTQTELSTLQQKLAEKDQADRIKAEQIRQMDESMRSMQQKLDAISKALSLNPSVEAVEAALRRKRNVNQR